ncbi:MAG: DUF305 domain-containing protein [Actinobacteria bacterium]|nr:DUF305 domain-containing protein [Actinomycetota bacterium]
MVAVKSSKGRWAVVVAAVLAIAGIGIAMAVNTGNDSSSSTGSMNGMSGMSDSSMTSTTGTNTGMASMGTLTDRRFIEMMIPHHQSAVAMAKIALNRSSRTEVRTLASGIVSAQESEIGKMRGWYRQWFGTDVPTTQMSDAEMAMMGMGSGDTNELATTKAFDRTFLSMMLAHHASAIVMASQVAKSERAEIRRLSAEIIGAQAREVGQMQGWRSKWFPPLG